MNRIPEGFVRVRRPRPNPFNEMIGPFYERRNGKEVSLGLRTAFANCYLLAAGKRIVRANAIFALSGTPN